MRRATALTAVLTLLCLAAFAGAFGASFPGRNGLIAFSSNRSGQSYDLYLMTARGRVTTRLTMTRHVNEGSPAWSADGRRISYVRRDWSDESHPGPFEIWVMRSDGTERRRLVRGTDPAWSPDGRRIAFTGASTPRITRPDLWVMDSDGSDKRRLTFTRRASEREPDWSPNGRLIAYMSNVEGLASGQSAIYTMRPDGSHQRRLTPLGARTREPSWSPDGTRIAFKRWASGVPAGAGVLWTMDADGSNEQPLAIREIGTCAWSPDGNSILFDATEPHPLADIFSIPPGGGEPTPLVSGPADDNSPAWQPRPGPAAREHVIG